MNQPSTPITKPSSSSNASNPNPSTTNNTANADARLMAAPTTTTTTTTGAECGNCRSQKRWVLHHVRMRGIHRRLCTSCVLRLHPSCFCPGCLQFYDPTSPPPPTSAKRLACSKCSSFTHSHCASHTTPSSPYLCPPCANPSFSFFDLDSDPNRAVDKRLALVLLCAAKIASASMSKAVHAARAEAERRVKEAALARKRAREALDHLALLVHNRAGKAVRKDVAAEGSAEVSGSANQKDKDKDNNKTPVVTNSHGKETFNGFASPRQKPAAPESPNKKINNGELRPAPPLQTNGNGSVRDREKSGGLDSKQSMELEPKNHGGIEHNAPQK